MHDAARKWLIVPAAVAVLLGHLGDVLTTHLGLARFGLNEGNPTVAHVINSAGIGALYAIKIVLGVLTAVGIVWLWDKRHALPMAGALLIAIYANWALWHDCVWWNIKQMASV